MDQNSKNASRKQQKSDQNTPKKGYKSCTKMAIKTGEKKKQKLQKIDQNFTKTHSKLEQAIILYKSDNKKDLKKIFVSEKTYEIIKLHDYN